MALISRDCTIKIDRGLHARSATELMKLCDSFQADIQLINEHGIANTESILQVLSICAGFDSKLKIKAQGPEAEKAIEAIVKFLTP